MDKPKLLEGIVGATIDSLIFRIKESMVLLKAENYATTVSSHECLDVCLSLLEVELSCCLQFLVQFLSKMK